MAYSYPEWETGDLMPQHSIDAQSSIKSPRFDIDHGVSGWQEILKKLQYYIERSDGDDITIEELTLLIDLSCLARKKVKAANRVNSSA